MLTAFLQPLGARLGLGLALLLAILLGVQTLRLNSARADAGQLRADLAAVSAQRDAFRQAGEIYVAEGRARQARSDQALQAQQRQSRAIAGQIARIRAAQPAPGCDTPKEVLDAAGL